MNKAITEALAIARRQSKPPTPPTKSGEATKLHVGAIKAPVSGRTDNLPIHVPSNSYVIPADIISAVGEGNSQAGFEIIDYVMKQHVGKEKDYSGSHGVAVVVAGGEYVIPPDAVASFGNGDVNKGHKALDDWVVFERKKTIKTLRKLPPPKKD